MIHNYKACWPTLGTYTEGPKGPFLPKIGPNWAKALGAGLGARFGQNCRRLVQLGWNHGYHTLSPGIGPLLGLQGPQRARFGLFWGSWMDSEGPGGQIWS